MNNLLKHIKKYTVKSLFIISFLTINSCAEEEAIAPCVSQFYYEGTPFRQGDNLVITPKFESGEEIAGEFTSTEGLVILDKQTGQVDVGASVPGVYTVRKAMIGNPGCGNRITLGVIAILPPPAVFNLAESLSGWGLSGASFLDNTDKKEGESSIKTKVDGLVIMQHNLATPLNAKVGIAQGELHFWLYISDPDQLEPNASIGQIELTSSGEPDKEELTWVIIPSNFNLKAGWNQMKLKFKDAGVTGGNIDLNAIKFFRLYMFPKEGAQTLTVGIDDMKILAES
ncbi:hypothetical protein ACFRAE_05645 [Sphingobacterium sp. HJSM2_6]|uniref:hypothetical protein n=1 Tax=Sphingobacterium sp. HJSM2_6 TaxID=3366264 RepID=UPI003BC27688